MPIATSTQAPTIRTPSYAARDAVMRAVSPHAAATPHTSSAVSLPSSVQSATRRPSRIAWRVTIIAPGPGTMASKKQTPRNKGRLPALNEMHARSR